MKTSNKIVLFSVLGFIGLLLTAHLTLYSKYQSGQFVTEKEMEAERFVLYTAPSQPVFLSLRGPMRINIFPSDSFRLALSKEDIASLHYRRDGDTLVAWSDAEVKKNAHSSWFDFLGLPRVNVYCPSLRGIRIKDCFVALQNQKALPGLRAALDLDNTQLYIGEYNPEKDSAYTREPYDSVFIESRNSFIVLNRQAYVKKLWVGVDDNSELIDRFSRIDTATVRIEKNSRLQLTGFNFNKIRVIPAPDIRKE